MHKSTEEAVSSAIPNLVDTAGTSSAVGHSVSKGREYTRNKFLSSSDFTSEDESYDNASEKMSGTEEYELPVVH
jgi:hypothetical protein